MLGISRVKSPVTLVDFPVSRPFTSAETVRYRATNEVSDPLRPHAFPELVTNRTVFMVCVSGGGARASRMAAHTLSLLEEKYNERFGGQPGMGSLAERVDVWSTVSGGSVFASFVARDQIMAGAATNRFGRIATERSYRWATRSLGGMAAVYYFAPVGLIHVPLRQFLTEWDTLDLFARTHAMLFEGRFPLFPGVPLRKLGDLPARPCYLFNATCLETSRPFIFTRQVLHGPKPEDPLTKLVEDPLVLWALDAPVPATQLREPFMLASTLEDLGSPPADFPLSYAVMASAAFPGVFQPLRLPKYRNTWSDDACPVAPARVSPPILGGGRAAQARHPGGPSGSGSVTNRISVVDGGVYENTGVATALQLHQYLQQQATNRGVPPPRLVLLSIDANNTPDEFEPSLMPPNSPIQIDLPLRGLASAVSTMSKIYDKQQALAWAVLRRHLNGMEAQGQVKFVSVRLLDHRLQKRRFNREADRLAARLGGLNPFWPARNIPTDFVLTAAEDDQLRETVRELVGERQGASGAPSVSDKLLEALGPR